MLAASADATEFAISIRLCFFCCNKLRRLKLFEFKPEMDMVPPIFDSNRKQIGPIRLAWSLTIQVP